MGGASPDFASRFILRPKPPAVIASFSPTEAWTRSRESEKAAKNVFAGIFAQIESILFSSENRYRESGPHYFRVVLSLYATRNEASKICCAFLFSLGYISLLTFLRVVFQFSHSLPFAVDRSFLRHRFFMVSAAFNFKRRSFKSRKRKRIKTTSSWRRLESNWISGNILEHMEKRSSARTS